jgi:hypothetical protein
MARKEVAALRRELDERLAGYAAVLTRQGEKVEALESFEASVTPKVLTLEHDREQRALSATVDGRAWRALSERVSALEAGYETDRKDDELTARTRAFLVRLHGVAMPHKVCDEWKALLEAWGE